MNVSHMGVYEVKGVVVRFRCDDQRVRMAHFGRKKGKIRT